MQADTAVEVVYESENNNTKDAANNISGNKKVVGAITTGDVDFYKYKATKKGYVDFSFKNEESLTDSLGWNIYIYDSSLKEVGSWKYVCANQVFGNVIVKKGTVLYIKVEKGSESETLGLEALDKTYSITPQFKAKTYLETEKNNSCSKTNSIKLKKSYTGALNGNEDTDYYKIKATSKGTYKASLNLKKAIENGYSLVVYDSKKKEIKSVTDIKEKKTVKFKVKKGKTYYVLVKHSRDLSNDSMVIGTSAIIDTEIDGAVGMNSGIFNNPFIIWGRYKKKWFKYYLTLSFQFHHTQMDGAHVGRFLANWQKEINSLK